MAPAIEAGLTDHVWSLPGLVEHPRRKHWKRQYERTGYIQNFSPVTLGVGCFFVAVGLWAAFEFLPGTRTAIAGAFIFVLFVFIPITLGVAIIRNQLRFLLRFQFHVNGGLTYWTNDAPTRFIPYNMVTFWVLPVAASAWLLWMGMTFTNRHLR